MLVKSNFHKVRQLGCGRPVYQVKYKRMRGDGFLDIIKGLFTGGAKLLGNLFRSSGAKQLAQKALSSGVELAKETAKEGVKSLAKDVASDPIKYVNKATELVDKLKSSENPQQVAKQEAQAFAKDILKIAKEKVVQPTIDQYRDDYEGVKEKLKNDAVAQVQNLQNNANNILAGMGLPKKRRSKNSSKSNKKSPKENIRGSGRVPAGGEKISNSKIMHKLRGAGLVPL